MFWSGTVLRFDAPGEKRVRNAAGHTYILNTNRMFQITTDYKGDASMIFFDNGLDEKDSGSRLVADSTIAGILLAADHAFGSNDITLDHHPEYDLTHAVESITLRKTDIAYAFPYNFDNSTAHTWLVYRDAAWKMKKILVDMNWIPLAIALFV
jgi:hypothetical protein